MAALAAIGHGHQCIFLERDLKIDIFPADTHQLFDASLQYGIRQMLQHIARHNQIHGAVSQRDIHNVAHTGLPNVPFQDTFIDVHRQNGIICGDPPVDIARTGPNVQNPLHIGRNSMQQRINRIVYRLYACTGPVVCIQIVLRLCTVDLIDYAVSQNFKSLGPGVKFAPRCPEVSKGFAADLRTVEHSLPLHLLQYGNHGILQVHGLAFSISPQPCLQCFQAADHRRRNVLLGQNSPEGGEQLSALGVYSSI